MPHKHTDGGAGPGAMLVGLLVLGHVDLVIVALVDERDVVGHRQIGGVQSRAARRNQRPRPSRSA